MQFLAFLNDSYREAKSGWMLQIMLVLAGLLIVLVASISFRPAGIEDQLAQPFKMMTRFLAGNPAYDQMGRPEFRIENVSASNKSQPWKSDYEFDFVVACPSPADMRKAHKSGLPTTRPQVRSHFRTALQDYETVVIEDLTSAGETNAHLAVGGAILAVEPPVTSPEARYRIAAKGSKIDDPLAWPHKVTILFFYENPFFHISLRDGVYMIEKWLVNKAGAWVLLLVSVVITAGSIPSMLAKGSLDLLISKPIGRTRLLVYKYIGGLTFVFLLTAITVVGVWLMIGLRSGIWSVNFLAIIPILTFYFAVLYSVSAAAAIFTRNTLVAILLTGLAWGAFWLIGKVNDGIENRQEAEAAAKALGPNRPPPIAAPDPDDPTPRDPFAELEPDAPLWGVIPKSVFPYATALHAITPRTYQLDDRLSRVIAEGVLTPYQLKKQGYDKPPRESWETMIGVSLAFIVLILALSAWRFQTRDH